MASNNLKMRLMASVLPIAVFTAGAAHAQTPEAYQVEEEAAAAVDDVIVTGIRGRPRSVQDSPVPVDVFSAEDLAQVAQTDTLNTLQTLIPSFSVSRSNNTTSNTFIRSPTLRGLPANNTLLLVNGRRRHKSASVGTSGAGSQAADASVIPAIALSSSEVLRDGAAAQYGSDAIAGVINFNLKTANHGGSLMAQAGQHYEGDGDDYIIAGNIGLPLTENGFVNLSAQWTRSARTIRSNQFVGSGFDAIEYAKTNPTFASLVNWDEPLERVGRPKEEALRFVVNSGLDLTSETSLYAFGNYSQSLGTAAGNYRYPGGNHPVLDNPIRLQDGTIFRFKELYPGGLRPQFSGEVTDWSVATGVRDDRTFSNGMTLQSDVGVRYGWDKIDYSIVDTLNPSLGPTSQQDFRASNYVSNEFAVNADFALAVPVAAFSSPLDINFGAEYRREGFEIRPGEEASYTAGLWSAPDPFDYCTNEAVIGNRTLRATAPQTAGINCALASDPIYNTLAVGSNGITGLPPANTGEYEDTSYSFYGEVSADITEKWFLDIAARFEDYESFGSTVIGKVATRYALTDNFALRASVGTGFRAPTAGQINMTQVGINTVNGVPTNTGLYPATNPVAVFMGAKPLQPEESTNVSVGITAKLFTGFDLTIDAYQIDISDQVYSTAQMTVTPAIRAAMIAANIPGADTIASINFFQNAFDSTVSGVDVVASYRTTWSNGWSSGLVGSFNNNRYEIADVKIAGLFNAQSIFNFENNQPEWRASITANHSAGRWGLMSRANIYGPYARQATGGTFAIQDYDPEVMFDAEVTYDLTDSYKLAVGARNLFDQYPDPNYINSTNGRIYADGAVDWQGGFYYARVTYSF